MDARAAPVGTPVPPPVLDAFSASPDPSAVAVTPFREVVAFRPFRVVVAVSEPVPVVTVTPPVPGRESVDMGRHVRGAQSDGGCASGGADVVGGKTGAGTSADYNASAQVGQIEVRAAIAAIRET